MFEKKISRNVLQKKSIQAEKSYGKGSINKKLAKWSDIMKSDGNNLIINAKTLISLITLIISV